MEKSAHTDLKELFVKHLVNVVLLVFGALEQGQDVGIGPAGAAFLLGPGIVVGGIAAAVNRMLIAEGLAEMTSAEVQAFVGSGLPALSLSTARSEAASRPTSRAGYSVPSGMVTVIDCTSPRPSATMTWLLVTT